MRIVWSPQSLRDLHAIREYIAKDSERYADLTVARIFSAVERLLQFPRSGRIVPERNDPKIREIIVGRFRLVYRVRDALLEAATVFSPLLGPQREFCSRCVVTQLLSALSAVMVPGRSQPPSYQLCKVRSWLPAPDFRLLPAERERARYQGRSPWLVRASRESPERF